VDANHFGPGGKWSRAGAQVCPPRPRLGLLARGAPGAAPEQGQLDRGAGHTGSGGDGRARQRRTGGSVQLLVEVGRGRSRGSFGLKISFFRTSRVHPSAHGKSDAGEREKV
jgi:hypothetical protein